MSHPPTSKTYHPPKLKPQATPGRKCWACGGPSHGQKNDRAARSRSCEACAKCPVKGHFTTSCSKCNSCGKWGHRDATSRFCGPSNRCGFNPKGTPDRGRVLHTEDDTHGDDSVGHLYDQLCTMNMRNDTTCTGRVKPVGAPHI